MCVCLCVCIQILITAMPLMPAAGPTDNALSTNLMTVNGADDKEILKYLLPNHALHNESGIELKMQQMMKAIKGTCSIQMTQHPFEGNRVTNKFNYSKSI